jgi:hypothetical protein
MVIGGGAARDYTALVLFLAGMAASGVAVYYTQVGGRRVVPTVPSLVPMLAARRADVDGRVVGVATESGRIGDYVYDASPERPRYNSRGGRGPAGRAPGGGPEARAGRGGGRDFLWRLSN